MALEEFAERRKQEERESIAKYIDRQVAATLQDRVPFLDGYVGTGPEAIATVLEGLANEIRSGEYLLKKDD